MIKVHPTTPGVEWLRPDMGPITYSNDDPYFSRVEVPLTARLPYYQIGPATGRLIAFGPPGQSKIRKPVFVMWGFDPSSKGYTWQQVYNLMNGDENENIPLTVEPEGRLLVRLVQAGYDVCVVVPDDTLIHLQANAFLLLTAMERVHEELPPDTTNAIIGLSAGGIIARWLLNWMTDYRALAPNMPVEKTTHYFSYDTPHRGANVPVVLQYLLMNLAAVDAGLRLVGKDLGEDFAKAFASINSTAARQLSLYRVATPSQPDEWVDLRLEVDPLRTDLLNELGSRWPQGMRRYAVSNGVMTCEVQPANPRQVIMEVRAAGFAIRAMPESDVKGQIFSLTHAGPWVNISPGGAPLDSVPGSYSKSFFHKVYRLAPQTFGQEPLRTCFVPSLSAMDISDDFWSYAAWNNVASGAWKSTSAFHDHCAPSGVSERHVEINRRTTDFILQKLAGL
jgi:hypothetical protein